jgi:WD40 repeat protein
MEQNKEYFVFISYSSLDNEWAIWLRHELEHYHLPASFNGRTDVRDNLRKVFRDRDELSAGPEWDEQVQKALEDTNNLIVICSPHSAKSDAVNKEIETFIALGKEDHIFPFIVEGNKPEDCFPPALRHSKLGGDVNKDGGRDSAFIKVVAGMLKVSFPSLWNRYEIEKAEEERKIREQRDKLLIMQSRFLAEKANSLVDEGDSYTARLLALEALPKDLKNPDRPYVPEAEAALRNSYSEATTIDLPKRIDNCYDEYGGGTWVEINSSSCSPCVLEFSPDRENLFLMGTEDGAIYMLDAKDGRIIKAFFGHTDTILSIRFNACGSKFASSSEDGTVRIWNIEDGYDIADDWIGEESENVVFKCIFNTDVAFSPCGQYLAIAISNKIVIKDVETRETFVTLEGHSDKVNSIIYCPDGKRIISASDDCSIRIWDILEKREILTLKEHSDHIKKIAYCPIRNLLVSCSSDYSIIVWKISITSYSIEYTFWGGADFVNFNSTGELVVYEGGIINWAERKEIVTFDNTVIEAKYSKESRYMVLCRNDKTIHITDSKLIERYFTLKCPYILYNAIISLLPKPNLLIAYNEDSFALWDIKNLNLLLAREEKYLKTNSDGSVLLSKCNNIISFWNIITGEIIGKIPNVKEVFFTPDEKYIISINDVSIGIWGKSDMQFLQEIKRDFEEEKHEGCVLYYYDNCQEKKFQFYPRSLQIKFSTEQINDSINNSFQCGYYTIIDKEVIEIRQSGSRKLVNVLCGHRKKVTTAIISKDSRYVLSTSKDENVIIVWNLNSGVILKKIEESNVSQACFTDDFNHIISVGDRINIWTFSPLQELIDQTRERFKNRQLTPEERKKYYLD